MDICPFTKQPCGQKKTLHVTELKDGTFTELHMCQKCSEQYMNPPPPPPSNKPPTPPSVGGLLGLLALMFLGSAAAKKRAETRQVQPPKPQCPGCGVSPEEIVKTGRFGCPKCYEYYHDSIEGLLVKYQAGAIKHVGKKPQGYDEAQEKRRLEQEAALDVSEQIKNLESKMANAVKVENYEVAGVLKQKIEELRSRLTADVP